MGTKRHLETRPNLRVISEETVGEMTSSDTLPLMMPPTPNEAEQARAAAATVSKRMAPPATPTAPSTDTTRTPEDRTLTASWHLCRALLVVLAALAGVVAQRAILLLAVLASAVLTWRATQEPSLPTLSATAVFDLTVVVPLVWLYYKRG